MTVSNPRSQASRHQAPGSQAASNQAPDLGALRVEIDRIDEALHRLLMDRGAIIDELIAVKARGGGGSAFRPGREAEMMRRLVQRHAGILPLDTVESIWRIIISTFTFVQAPYAVHADVSGGDATMRDSCRFHFGFTVPLVTHAGAGPVIAAVAAADGDLGLVRADDAAAEAWWAALADPAAPKIIARLPFVERADHAAGLPLFVVAKPLAEAAVSDVRLYAVEAPAMPAALRSRGVELVVSHPSGRHWVLAIPDTVDAGVIAAAVQAEGGSWVWIGSHARRFDFTPAPAFEASPAAP